jgi:hypothetical protein
MKGVRLVILGMSFLIFVGSLGCASHEPAPWTVLDPPPDTTTQVQAFFTEGNRLFHEGRWEGARQKYQSAVQAQPDLAEAHYNLALAMDHMGYQAEAKPHFIKAANLAPGNKVIWDSPPLKRFGNVPDAPIDPATSPILPGVGGGVGGVGGGGPGGGF